MKRLFKCSISIIIVILLFCSLNKKEVFGESITSVEVIFSDVSLISNEKLKIDINLVNVYDLYEVDIKLNIDNRYLKYSDKFSFNASSIFSEDPLINDYQNNILRLKLVKNNDILNGYNSSIKSNLCYLELTTNIKIEDIKDYINNSNLSIKLYDINGELIQTNINYSEKLKYKWDKEEYYINVYDNIKEIKNDIVILNRKENEYKLSIDHDININKTGEYSILLVIFDVINNEIIKDSKKVFVVDLIKPVITCNVKNFLINDTDIDYFNVLNYFSISDNYDKDLNLIIEYYDINNNLLEKEEFFNYLKSNLNAFIIVYTTDSANNESDRLKYKISINDTICPSIEYKENINIDSSNLSNFNIEDYIEIYDNYDKNPMYSVTYFDQNDSEIFDLKAYFELNLGFSLEILVFDNMLNYSEKIKIFVNVTDSISPTLEVKDIIIDDTELLNFDINDYIKYSDNIDKELDVKLYLYINNNLIEIINNDFNNNLIEYFKVNSNLKYFIEVKDSSGNITSSNYQIIQVNDLTSPIIKISNDLEVISFNDLNLSISDNKSANLFIEYYLDNKKITIDELMNLTIGEYKLKIIVIDESNNKTELEKEFKIVEKINNKIDFNIESLENINNYYIIIILIFIISFGILFFKKIKLKKFTNSYVKVNNVK